MHVYIDESGPFAFPNQPKPAISICGALVIRSRLHDSLLRAFKNLSSDWPKENGEVKGKLLSEENFDDAINLLSDYGSMLEIVGIDLGMQSAKEIHKHKAEMLSNMDEFVSVSATSEIKSLRQQQADILRGMKTPSYVQMILTYRLAWRLIQKTWVILSVVSPSELSSFKWVIDGKNISPTKMEVLMDARMTGWMQHGSLNNPIFNLKEGDYSHVPEEVFDTKNEFPDYLLDALPPYRRSSSLTSINIFPIFEDRTFATSSHSLGLQMADVAISAVRRAAIGNLRQEGWKRLGSLLMYPALPDPDMALVLPMFNFGDQATHWEKPAYESVFLTLRRTARRYGPPSWFEWVSSRR